MTSNSTPDKVAVVTGASSGIGAATARALAADGYRVALLARRRDRITTLADELGNGSTAIEADVTDRDSIVAAADRVRQELGTADALINNAGVMLLGPFDSDQREDYRQMIEVNLLGAITAAVFFAGGFVPGTLVEEARQVTIPLQFLLQWDDEGMERQPVLDLFDAFGTKEKTLHANLGGHAGVPWFEVDAAARFFARHLTGG